jgi:AraC family transcriptional regulator, transcriptional activator of pobA
MKEDHSMTETEILLAKVPIENKVDPYYSGDDIMIIDNAKLLVGVKKVRPNMNIIAICTKGKFEAYLNGKPIVVRTANVFICPPEASLANIMVSPDFEYLALCISNRALQIALRSHINIWNQYIYVKKNRIIELCGKDIERCEKSYDLLHICLDQSLAELGKEYRDGVIKGLVSSTLIGLCGLIEHQTRELIEIPRRSTSFFNRFLELLQSNEVRHRSVKYYASALCISPKYLTIICKKNSDKTANEWIREYTLFDITDYLRNTPLSIKEISNKMGFPNTSFFGKYVKANLGHPPLEYRKNSR